MKSENREAGFARIDSEVIDRAPVCIGLDL
jgi:hypothetical protein